MKKIFIGVLIITTVGMFIYNKDDKTNEKQVSQIDTQKVLDLTSLSTTMVYGEVYNILVNPNDYIGKTIKMSGQFKTVEDNTKNEVYTFCITMDNEQCCSQWVEILLDESIDKDDYPKEEALITVEGKFESYEDGGKIYYRLGNTQLL